MKEDIIRMARRAGAHDDGFEVRFVEPRYLERFAALVAAAERNKVAQWMIDHSYATGHGDTTEDLLDELDWQITESWSKVVVASVEAEREACAEIAETPVSGEQDDITMQAKDRVAAAIRARGQDAA
jgi:hypothetical protein